MMVLMILILLIALGLCFGSFTNALVWRIHEQDEEHDKTKPSKKYLKDLSISKGRSMCPDCKHTLAAKDLVPVLSWLSTRGKCRYCKKPISAQYPIVELATAALFVASYIWWPQPLAGSEVISFAAWLVLLIGFMALTVYDFHWFLLPNRIMFPLVPVAALLAIVEASRAGDPLRAVIYTALGVLIGGGIFYALFQFSKGKWIGGGDVKLGWLLGLVVGTPGKALLVIFLASILGSLMALPFLLTGKLKRTSTIPFGPFLIAAAVITVLFGTSILDWYQRLLIGY